MASDVIRGGTDDRRSYRNVGLAQLGILSVVALALAVDGSDGHDSRLAVPALVGLGLLLLWTWWWAIPRLASSGRVEIGPDAIRWRGAWHRRDRVISRADVVTARFTGRGRFPRLDFYEGTGRRVGALPLSVVPAGRVIAALRRHGWPVSEL